MDLVSGAELGSGPDLLGPVHAPRGNIQIHSPYLDVSAFNPRQIPRKGDNKRFVFAYFLIVSTQSLKNVQKFSERYNTVFFTFFA